MNIDPRIARTPAGTAQSGSLASTANGSNPDVGGAAIEQANHERWARLPKTRGRQPRDPHAQSLRFPCRDIEDLERQLREYLQAPTAPAEHATLEFVYPVSSAFSVYTTDIRNKQNTQHDEKAQLLYGKLDRSAISVIDALAQSIDPKDRMRRQKAIAKVCVEACERADGYRYSFHNNWLSREDEACRFSYFCNDSTLNKGRAANEGASTVGKKMRKAVYNCQGLIAIKFSLVKQSLEVHYKHVPLHKTYAERAPPPRKDSKRYKLMEIFEPEKLPSEHPKRPRTQPSVESSPIKRSRKKQPVRLSDDHGNVIDDDAYTQQRDLDNNIGTESPTPQAVDVAVGRSAQEPGRHQLGQDTNFSSMHAVTPTRVPQTRPSASRIGSTVGSINRKHQSGLTWVNPNEISASPRVSRQRVDGVISHNLAEANVVTTEVSSASAISMSDFEALKAKLEAAEQRIRNLEAEKQSVPPNPQSPSWTSFPHPPPPPPPPPPASHYPYAYYPPAFSYSPTAMMPTDYTSASSIVTPQRHIPAASHQFDLGTETNALKDTTGHEPSTSASQQRERQQSAKSGNVRAFVAYTPKPQRPVLNAQRQDAGRASANSSRKQS